jgi:hypothetical protein
VNLQLVAAVRLESLDGLLALESQAVRGIHHRNVSPTLQISPPKEKGPESILVSGPERHQLVAGAPDVLKILSIPFRVDIVRPMEA